MEYIKFQDKCRGSLVGGAVGDALGYEVEFMSLSSIRKRFGEKGISRFVLHNGVAQFSDDTQMTLFTAEGLLTGMVNSESDKPKYILPYIQKAYLNWYKTQTETPRTLPDSWLSNLRSLWARRAPGNTCMNALENLANGFDVCNDSKGCGGVMRVAPIGIYEAAHKRYVWEDLADLSGWSADLTHKHIASSLASVVLVLTVKDCLTRESITRDEFATMVNTNSGIARRYYSDYRIYYLPKSDEPWIEFNNLLKKAVDLGMSDMPESEAISLLGEGWVGDEALAIAIFSVVRHFDSFEDCIVCAVNHDGDSDSTGAIAGNIIGAIHGYSSIPKYFLESLEIEPLLVSVADDLCCDRSNTEGLRRITDRYMKHLPTE